MKNILRYILQLALILWLGGIFFFGAVMAPSVFMMLSYMKDGTEFAGMIIGQALYGLHSLAQICGVVFLLASMLVHRRLFRLDHLLVAVMLALTAASQYGITPRMQTIRTSVTRMDQLAPADERRIEFDRLHKMSTALEGTVFLLGLVVVGLGVRREEV